MTSGLMSADCQLAKWTERGVSGKTGRSLGPKQLEGVMSLWKPVLTPCNKQSKRFTSASNMTKPRLFITSKNMGWRSRRDQLTSTFFARKKSEIRLEKSLTSSELNGGLGFLRRHGQEI